MSRKTAQYFYLSLKAFVGDLFKLILIKAFMVNEMTIDDDFMSRKTAQYF